MVKLALRSKSVGTKVTEAEFAALEARAQAQSLTLSEWVRTELLEPSRAGGNDVLLGEVLALRTILINLLFSVSKGEPITSQAMNELIQRADADKTNRALERLSAVQGKKLQSAVELAVETRA
jgi:hypothetical protein